MDPISSPELDSEAPPSGAPGQVIGPGGTVLPPQPVVAQVPQPAPVPPTTPAVIVTPSSTPVASPSPPALVSDPSRPIAVGESLPPASSVILPPQPASFGVMSFNETSVSTKPSLIKKLTSKKALILAAVPLLLLGGSAAAYFGYIAPNQPDNIWAKAMSNTGKGYDKLSEYTQKQFGSTYSGIKEDGTFKISGGFVADGDFHGVSNGNNGEFTGNLSASGAKLSLDIRSIKPAASDTPDLYIKVSGLDGLASLLGSDSSGYGDLVKKVDGNWYFVDHTLFEQYAGTAGSDMKLTQADIKSILDAIGSASKQNVFTTDQSKMAFQVKQKLGKQKMDGRTVYHFKVGVNKDNLKTYVKALCTNLKSSSLKKLLNNNSSSIDSALDCSSVEDSVNSVKDNNTADVWVDMRTKLIHKIRFTDSSNSNNYVDIGQDYQGGDSLPFSLTIYDKEPDSTFTGNLNVTLNMKTNAVNINGSFKASGTDNTSGSLDITVIPSNDKVNVQKPDGATNVLDLINNLGFGDLLSSGLSPGGGADTERKTDINALHGQLEAYWATNGYYPTLANLNDSKWVSANLVGMDPEALKDPAGLSSQIVSSPAPHAYAYQVTPAGCDNVKVQCQNYTLTATLNDGSTYVKQDLNDNSSTSILN